MSAMGQGGEAAQQTQGQNGGGEGDAQQQQAQPDFNDIVQRLDQIAGGHEELRQHLLSAPWEQQTERAPAEQELDLATYLDSDFEGDPEEVRQQRAQQAAMQQYIQQEIQKGTAPAMERVQEMERTQAVRDFVAEFPEFGTDEQLQNELLKNAKALAETYNRPELALEPWFWRMTHLAQAGMVAAQQEGVDTPEPAHLEGGGGAIPGGPQVDTRADEIMNAGGKKGSGVLPF